MLGLKNFYFLIPIIGMIPWVGMLIAMLICWAVQGEPMYPFMGFYQDPVYISYIGATNLQPLFISCAAWQGVFYGFTLLLEYWLRKTGRLQYWFKKTERNLLFIAVFFAVCGQIAIILVSIFNIKNYKTAHDSLLAVFIVCIFVSMCFVIAQYFCMAKNYQKIHVSHKKWNKFLISGVLKIIWVVVALVLAICFEAVSSASASGGFEWALAFWYLFLWLIFAWDIYPAAKYHHKNSPYIRDWSTQGFYLYDKNYGNSNDLEKNANLEQEQQPIDNEREDTLVYQSSESLNQNQQYDNNMNTNNNATTRPVNREFNDDELAQYPVTTDHETYPIPDGQQVPVYNRVQ